MAQKTTEERDTGPEETKCCPAFCREMAEKMSSCGPMLAELMKGFGKGGCGGGAGPSGQEGS